MNKETLLQKFKQLKADYVKAFKSRLLDSCRKIGDQLSEIAVELRKLGLTNEGLGLSEDGQYILRCINSARTNPADYSEVLLNDAERLLDESIPIKRYTLRGWDSFKVDENGALSLPEKEETPQPSDNPPRLIRRNCDIQREMAGEN